MKYLSVCSGMEAASVAWHPLGWQPVGFSEIEPFPCAILKHRFPNTPNYGSLTEHHTWPIEPGTIDLLVGGTPCQSYSVAGKRGGLNDPRGQLMLCFLDLAARLKPKYVIWENVPGVLSSGQPRGSDFATFLQGLAERGYGWAYRVLDAQHFGVPQRRRRVFVVACLGDWRAAAEVLFESDCVRRDPKKGRAKGQGSAAGVEGGVGADHPEGCWWDGGQVSQTLDAVLQKGQTMPEKNRFPAVLQPKPVVIDRAAFNQGQNAQYEPHIGESEVMDSLVARGPHAVGQPLPIAFKVRGGGNYSGTKGGEVKPDEKGGTGYLGYEDKTFTVATTQDQWVAQPVVAPTVTTCKGSKGGCSDEAIAEITAVHLAQQQAAAIPIQDGREIEKKQNGIGVGNPGDPAYTIDTTGAQAAAIPFRKSKRACSTTDNETWVEADASNTLNNFDLGDTRTTHAVVEKPMAVRRLTPVECERLQGFPDNWSRISWKGKPEDQCPDGPRYKACGNSMAVPVMRWIGERIAAADAKHFPHA